ncbi:hypothetical protein ISR92_03315 [Patescibacteria group bacterium]|nr:hypothetical protein [Patescibacteria group bacterium]
MSIRFKSLAYFFYTLGGIVLGVLLTVFVGVMKDTDTYIEMTQILMPIYIYVLTFAFKYISLYIAERKPTIFHTT